MVATQTLGPWNGGLNLTSNRDLSVFLDSSELGSALNVVYSKEGFVQPRPGCKVLLNKGGIYDHYTDPATSRYDLLGSIKLSTGQFVVIAQLRTPTNTYIYKIFDTGTVVLYWTLPGTNYFTHIIQHDSDLGTPTPGQPELGHRGIMFFSALDNLSYVTDDYTLNTVPSLIPAANRLPGSSGGIIVKNRLFLWKNEASRFMWSPGNYVLDWTGIPNDNTGDDRANSLLIEPTTEKDGITSVQFWNNSFYIFKKTKMFMLTYQNDPAEDLYLRKVNPELGAFSSTQYRDQIVLVNNRGVYKINGTEFVDLQPQLNLRFEIPLDHTGFTTDEIFISTMNNDILLGMLSRSSTGVVTYYYYCMNGYTGAWSKWSFDYNTTDPLFVPIAAPGSKQFRCQNLNTTHQEMIFTTFDKSHIVYIDWKPKDLGGVGDYHLDTDISNLVAHDKHYFPQVNIKTKAMWGDSSLKFKKVYRVYIRCYISDEQVDITNYPEGLWLLSVNYNDYRFGVDTSHEKEQLLFVYPSAANLPIRPTKVGGVAVEDTAVYRRAYQLPIHQFRGLEFVFELTRKWTTTTNVLNNPDADRYIKQGYFFMLSSIFFDYEDKAAM